VSERPAHASVVTTASCESEHPCRHAAELPAVDAVGAAGHASGNSQLNSFERQVWRYSRLLWCRPQELLFEEMKAVITRDLPLAGCALGRNRPAAFDA
jgi:hypothetical protein